MKPSNTWWYKIKPVQDPKGLSIQVQLTWLGIAALYSCHAYVFVLKFVDTMVWWLAGWALIAVTGYLNLDKNIPEDKRCEACLDYGKWKRCENCVWSLRGIKHNNFQAGVKK